MSKLIIYTSLLMGFLIISTTTEAIVQPSKVFGEKYIKNSPVIEQLSQVIYYRAKSSHTSDGPAHVYVDGHYHTSLLAGGFTRFCLKPGEHILGAYINDPLYRGKSDGRFAAELKGGRTYYLSVNENQEIEQPPLAVTHQHGENEVKNTQLQIHAYSRADSIVPCVYDPAAVQNPSHFLLNNNQLFKDERNSFELSYSGIKMINEIVVALRQQHPLIRSVVLRLSAKDGEANAFMRAKAIRSALTLAAIQDSLISVEVTECHEACLNQKEDIKISAK